jgi:hypothetical protein
MRDGSFPPRPRTLPQNAKLHAMLDEIAAQSTLNGRTLTNKEWKIVMISGHAIATNEDVDLICGIEGEWCNLRESSASMSVERTTSLIEYIAAWAAQNGVRFKFD